MGGAASTARKEQEIEERRLVEEKSRLLLLQEQERERLRALEEAKEHKENELTPEQQELFEVSVEVNDAGFIASEPNSNGEAGSASMVVGGQHMPVNWNIIETDTFHTSSGKSFTCFQVESLEWYYVDWNKQNQAPAPIPDSWIRDGGYFLSKKRKDCGIGQRQLLPDTAASETEMTIDLPYLDIHTFPNSSHCYDPISNQMILWQQFPVVRHVRYSYDRKTCTWNPMSIELEQCIPEVRDAVLTIQNALRTTQHGGLEDPSREKIVQVLRDYSFDVEKTMQVLGADKARIKRSLSEESEQERLGYWESTPKNKSIDLDLEETADQFALTGKDDSAICLFPDEAAKSSTANTVNWRIGNLEKKLESSQETIAKLEQEKKELERLVLSLRLELAHQREENGQRDKALVETNAELLNQKDSFKRIESEYHSMRMTRLDVLPELSTRILQQKDVQIGKLACTVSNLHLRIDELENWRRKRSISSLTVIAELHKMRSEYSQFKMDTSALLRKLFRTSSEALKPIVERLLRAEERNRSTQDTLLVYSRTIRLLTNRVNNLRGGLESVCMVAGTVDRKSLVLPLGECGITIKAAEQKSINFLFDKVFFGPQDLYNGCVRQSVESCKDGVNFCVLVLGNDTSGKEGILQQKQGLFKQSVKGIFSSIQNQTIYSSASIRFTCIECCKEKAYDLLAKQETSLNISNSSKQSLQIKPEPLSVNVDSFEAFCSLQDRLEAKSHRIHALYSYSVSKSTLIYIFSIECTIANTKEKISSRVVFVDLPTPQKPPQAGRNHQALHEYLSVEQTFSSIREAIHGASDTGNSAVAAANGVSIVTKILTAPEYGRWCLKRDSIDLLETGRTLLVTFVGSDDDVESTIETLKVKNKLAK